MFVNSCIGVSGLLVSSERGDPFAKIYKYKNEIHGLYKYQASISIDSHIDNMIFYDERGVIKKHSILFGWMELICMRQRAAMPVRAKRVVNDSYCLQGNCKCFCFSCPFSSCG